MSLNFDSDCSLHYLCMTRVSLCANTIQTHCICMNDDVRDLINHFITFISSIQQPQSTCYTEPNKSYHHQIPKIHNTYTQHVISIRWSSSFGKPSTRRQATNPARVCHLPCNVIQNTIPFPNTLSFLQSEQQLQMPANSSRSSDFRSVSQS